MDGLFPDERLFFKYKCTHGKSDGDLCLTSHRFIWRPSTTATLQATFEYTWNNINKVKYSPANDPKGRSAINLDLAVPSVTGLTSFEFTGHASKEVCRSQLEKAKGVISCIKKGDTSSLEVIGGAEKSQSSRASSHPLPKSLDTSTSTNLDSSADGGRLDNTARLTKTSKLDESTRASLLASNRFIQKQYEDLVVNSNLLTEDEFWEANGPQVKETMINDKLIKGKTSSYIRDCVRVNEDELKNLPEAKKRYIFKVFPAVQKAYEKKNEDHISDEDFWRRYAYSFRHDSVGIDELFFRGLLSDESTVNMELSDGDVNASMEMYKKISDETIKLKDITDDYYRKSLDDSLRQYDDSNLKDIEKIDAVRTLTGGWNEYNQQSKVLLESSNILNSSKKRMRADSASIDADIDELNEIASNIRDQLIPLKMSKEKGATLSNLNPSSSGRANDSEYRADDNDSAFGKAAVVLVKSLRKDTTRFNAQEVLTSMGSIFPSSNQSLTYHQKEILELHSLTPSAAVAAGQGALSSSDAANLLSSGSSTELFADSNRSNHVDGHELSDEFKQELGEIFVSVTERMRHFYIFINREGEQAPKRGTTTEKKVVSIIEDLTRINDKLNSKKTKIMSTTPRDSSLHSPVLRDSYQQLIVTCPRPFGPIKELIIENVDIETVWEQLQFHNRPHNRYLRKAIGLLFKRITDRIQKEIDQENAQKSKKIKLANSRKENKISLKAISRNDDNDEDITSHDDLDADDSNAEVDDDDNDDENNEYDENENENDDDNEDDHASENEDEDEEDGDNFEGEYQTTDPKDLMDTNDIDFDEDFRDMEDNDEEEEEEDDDDDDDDDDDKANEEEDGIEDDYLEDFDGEQLNDEEFFEANADSKPDTPFERRQKKMAEQVAEIEKEISSKRSWELSGEVKAADRPQNSLLSSVADVERATKPAPIITPEFTVSVEEMIKRRITNGNFDNVTKPTEIAKPLPPVEELSTEKSNLGLGDIYAQEFEKKTLQMDHGGKEKQSALQKEVLHLYQHVAQELDALSNFFFSPTPVSEEITITSENPISLEDFIPMTHTSGIQSIPTAVLAKPSKKSKKSKKSKTIRVN